jgi:hypothetical protein
MDGYTPRALICLIEGESEIFQITPTGRTSIMELKNLIIKEMGSKVDALSLTLWKVGGVYG